jgi:hypothetical protein
MSDDHATVRAILDRWSLQTPGARREAGKRLPIREVDAAGPLQVILRTQYERRWVELKHEATGSAGSARRERAQDLSGKPPPAVDVWAAEANGPRDGTKWSIRVAMPRHSETVACPECTGWGRAPCRACHGGGLVTVGDREVKCSTCGGRGETNCPLCLASGRTKATPIVHIECGTADQVQVIEDDRLPLEVYLALQEASGGACVYREDAPARLEPRLGGGGGGGAYRGETGRHSPRVNEAVNRLLAVDPVEGSFKVHGQSLEVRRTPAFRVELGRGATIWVYGDPPRVFPDSALRNATWWAKRAAPWVAGLATLGGAIATGVVALL